MTLGRVLGLDLGCLLTLVTTGNKDRQSFESANKRNGVRVCMEAQRYIHCCRMLTYLWNLLVIFQSRFLSSNESCWTLWETVRHFSVFRERWKTAVFLSKPADASSWLTVLIAQFAALRMLEVEWKRYSLSPCQNFGRQLFEGALKVGLALLGGKSCAALSIRGQVDARLCKTPGAVPERFVPRKPVRSPRHLHARARLSNCRNAESRVVP